MGPSGRHGLLTTRGEVADRAWGHGLTSNLCHPIRVFRQSLEPRTRWVVDSGVGLVADAER